MSARQSLPGYPVKALALLPKQAVVTVSGKGMVGVHGIAARTFAAVDAERLSVSTIFQGSSESSIGFTVPAEEADRAVRAVRKALAHEIASGLIDGVQARADMAVMAVVGDGMAGTPGIAARVFSALAAGGINVIAIAQGSSERNISFVVASAAARRRGAARARRLPALEDRRRHGTRGAVHRRRAARLRAGGPGPGRPDCVASADRGACASWACSTAPATSSTPRGCRGRGCCGSPATRTRAGCSPRSAAPAPRRAKRSPGWPDTPCRGRSSWT